jgi:hypothetical protein
MATSPTSGPARTWILILSPVVILAFGQLTVRLLAPAMGGWSWAPFSVVYAVMLVLVIAFAGGRTQVRQWLRPSRGPWGWHALAIGIPALLTLPIFIPNWRLLLSFNVLVGTLLFLLVNPFLEECYWRGTLLDATAKWPRWAAIAYSTGLFALHHLWMGVIVAAGRHPSALAGPVLMGLVWSLTYLKTGSLRWAIAGHLVANLLSLSVPVFLGLYVPPAFPGG